MRVNTDAFDVDWSDAQWRWYSWELDPAVQAGANFGVRFRALLSEYGCSLDTVEAILQENIGSIMDDIARNENRFITDMEKDVFEAAAMSLDPKKIGKACDYHVAQYIGERTDVY